VFRSLNLRAEAAGGADEEAAGGADEEAAAFADEEALGFVEEGTSAVAAKVLAQGLSWIYLSLDTYSQEPLVERGKKPQIP
jgi:hypothetical protein